MQDEKFSYTDRGSQMRMIPGAKDLFTICALDVSPRFLKNQRLWELLHLFYAARNLRRNLAN
jgi:hypothetical protein